MTKILVVEGDADREFYSAICERAGVKNVEVKTPSSKGKYNAIDLFGLLLKQLPSGSIKHIGLVVDADHPESVGGASGFGATYAKISGVAANAGFQAPPINPKAPIAYLLTPPQGLQAPGVWIMPDNSSHGMVEDFVKHGVTDPAQKSILEQAVKTVASLKNPLFKPALHKSKVDVYTWLAWQKNPGSRLVGTVGNELIDLSNPLQAGFVSWLKKVFP